MKISVIALLQILLSLGIGSWVAYRIKDAMVAIILKLMPMRYKISENSVNLHGRIATITALVVIFSIGSGVFWVTSQLKPIITTHKKGSEKKKKQPLVKSQSPMPIEQGIITSIPSSEEEVIPESTISYYDDIIEEEPMSPKKRTVANIVSNEGYYIQIYALSKKGKAIKQCNYEIRKRNVNCVIGVIENHTVPYRILLGPFPSRNDAQSYQHQMQLKSMLRTSKQMDYFIQQ